jgi:hypothetical protein
MPTTKCRGARVAPTPTPQQHRHRLNQIVATTAKPIEKESVIAALSPKMPPDRGKLARTLKFDTAAESTKNIALASAHRQH